MTLAIPAALQGPHAVAVKIRITGNNASAAAGTFRVDNVEVDGIATP